VAALPDQMARSDRSNAVGGPAAGLPTGGMVAIPRAAASRRCQAGSRSVDRAGRSYGGRVADHLPSTASTDSTTPGLSATGFSDRWLLPVWPWLVLGVASIVAGGLVAAVVAHDPSEKPVWASSYLVLVAGLGQLGLVLGRALLAPRPPTSGTVARDFTVFALGNAGVVVGTLVDAVWLVDVGGALLVVALALMVWGVRAGVEAVEHRPQAWVVGLLWLYRVLVVVLLVSIPVGLVLARQ
jgi:hypothetical protein